MQCRGCDIAWTPLDIRMPEACPNCGAIRKYTRLACEACPQQNLNQAVEQSGFAALIRQINMFATFLHRGGTVTLDDLTPHQYAGLLIFWEEQDKHTQEAHAKAQANAHSKIQASYKTRPI